jgi:long-chain fatty acid transport protein
MKRLSRWIGVVGVVGGFCLAFQVNAAGFRNPPEGAAALGHNGAKVTLTDDASAISHNPAQLTELKGPQVLPAVTFVRGETEFISPMGTAETEDPWKILPNLFAAWPIENSRLVAGVGLTTPFGQSTVWDESGAFRYTAPYSASMVVMNVNPTLAARLNDRLSVGVGADAYWSQLEMKQKLPWSALTGSPLSPDGTIHAQGDGTAFGANAALSIKVTPNQTLGLTYRTPFSVDYEGDVEVSQMPAAAGQLGLTPSSDFDASIDFPAVAALGYGIKLSDTVRVGADIEWVQWSCYETLVLDGANNNPILNAPGSPNPMGPAVVRQDWDDSWTAGAGADWKTTPDLTLRAGYIYLESPVPDDTFSPTIPDADRHVVSVGLGYARAHQQVDLAYGYSIFPEREIRSNTNPAYNGEYDTSSHLFSVSYGYSF